MCIPKNKPQIILINTPGPFLSEQTEPKIPTITAAADKDKIPSANRLIYPIPLIKQTVLISSIKDTAPVMPNSLPMADA